MIFLSIIAGVIRLAALKIKLRLIGLSRTFARRPLERRAGIDQRDGWHLAA